MKKLILLLVAVIFVFSLAACGVPQAEYDELLEEVTRLKKEIRDLKDELEALQSDSGGNSSGYIEQSRISTDINAIGNMSMALKVAATDPSLSKDDGSLPKTLTLIWNCGGDGSIIVYPDDATGDKVYEDVVHMTVGSNVEAYSRAANTAGAYVTIVLYCDSGNLNATATNINDDYFLELLNDIY